MFCMHKFHRWQGTLNRSSCTILRYYGRSIRIKKYYSSRQFADSNHVLFISPTLLPEPTSSAAGVRTEGLLRHFLTSSNLFDKVHFASGNINTKETNDALIRDLRNLGMGLHSIPLNNADHVEKWYQKMCLYANVEHCRTNVKHLKAVIFDRFFAEEAYSHHFQKLSPDTLRVLDMQDMHSLRLARKEILDRWESSGNEQMMTKSLMRSLMECTPDASNETLLRELAAIHRSDLILVCSPEELSLLRNVYKVQTEKLVLAPFFTSPVNIKNPETHLKKHNQRFVFVGGYLHHPNLDAVIYLHNEIWPLIQAYLPCAEIHIYGAYSEFLKKKLGKKCHKNFHIHGYVDSLDKVFTKGSILLCPLRYGAGIKGKIVDAWRYGVPVITTLIGAEGMRSKKDCDAWGGVIAEGDKHVTTSLSVEMFDNQELRDRCVQHGFEMLHTFYEKTRNLELIDAAIKNAIDNLEQRRTKDYMSSILWHQKYRSTEYFSRWIQLKESTKKSKF